MEAFPKPEKEGGHNLGTSVLIAAALTGLTTAVEAQTLSQYTESNNIHVSTPENSKAQKENHMILSNLFNLEESVKKMSSKTAKEDALVFSFLKESDALRQASFNTTKWESSATFDAEMLAVNNPERNYKVITRNMSEIQGLLGERTIDQNYGGVKNSKVFSIYNPIDYYVIVGVDKEYKSKEVNARIRLVNMQTKEIVLREIKMVTTAEEELDQLKQIKDAVSAEVKVFLDSVTTK